MTIKSTTQLRGHCQRCGRLQAVSGWVAKHGYTVKDRGTYGYFAGVCPGASYRPIEEERNSADRYISDAREDATRLRALAADLKSGKKTPTTVRGTRFNGKTHEYEELPFAEAPSYLQQEAVDQAIYLTGRKAEHADHWAEQHTALCNAWNGKPLSVVQKPEPPAQILCGEQRVGTHRGVLTVRSTSGGRVRWTDTKGFTGSISTRAWRTLPLHTI